MTLPPNANRRFSMARVLVRVSEFGQSPIVLRKSAILLALLLAATSAARDRRKVIIDQDCSVRAEAICRPSPRWCSPRTWNRWAWQ